jgi:SAM-dependent methyltransferase
MNFRGIAFGIVWVVSVSIASACRPSTRSSGQADASDSAVAAATQPPSSAPSASGPPIDCPLHKAGVDPQHLRPFEDVEKYIAFLDRPDRELWQKPDTLIGSFGLRGSETVADVGAGSGYFSFRFARALPSGKVIATDIEPEMVRHIHHKATAEGIRNLQVVLGAADDPKVPAEAGLIFVCDVLHHVGNRQVWLSRLFEESGHGARLVIVEFKQGDLPQGPPASMKIPMQQVSELVTAAGFSQVSQDAALLPYQYVLTFRRP